MSKKKRKRPEASVKIDESYDKDLIRLRYAYKIAIICIVILAISLFGKIESNSIIEIFKAGFFSSIGFIFSQKISEN